MNLLAGVDVGTTSVKVALFDAAGEQHSDGTAPTPWTSTQHGKETSAGALVDAARQALRIALDKTPGATVSAVGVASMAEAGVLLNRAGEPVAPVISWHDRRDRDQLADLLQRLGAESFAGTTGLPSWPQWSLTKHRWLMDNHEPARTAARRLNIAEWIVRSLGGDEGCEQSLASRTGWLNLHTRDWWDAALDWSRADRSLLPDLVTAGTPMGRAADLPGLPELTGATLTVAGHDHQAAAVGVGAVGIGDELDSCGTAEAVLRTIEPGLDQAVITTLTAAGVTVGWHVVADRWCLLGATQSGLVLQQVMRRLDADSSALADLDRLAAAAPQGGSRVVIGDDLQFTGADDRGSVWRAATQAVTAEAAALSHVLSAAVGPHSRVVVTGGWSRSTALMAAKSEALGAVSRASPGESGARGAALVAGLACGVYRSYEEFPRPPQEQTPDRPRR